MKKTIDNILEKVLVYFLIILVLNILWQVVSRYVMETPSSFTDELSRILLVWTGLLAAAYGSGKNIHLAIDLIDGWIPESKKRLFAKIPYFIVSLFTITVLIIGGFTLVVIIASLKQTTPSLGIPVWLIYLSVPIAGILILYYNIFHYLTIKKHTN